MSRKNTPTDIRIACPWYKPDNTKVNFIPNYYLHQSSDWLVFPHELSGLTPDEIITSKTDLTNILALFT